jgi:hypothetical protein
MTLHSFQRFTKSWFLHLAIFFVIFNLFDSIDYLARTTIHGLNYTNPDGTQVTLWQRFIDHNFQRPDNLYLLAFTFLAEVSHQYIYSSFRWYIFLVLTVALSVAILIIFYMVKPGNPTPDYLLAVVPVAGYLVGYSLVKTFLRHRLYRLQVRLNHSQNELELLKHQLNPHFLFNTLNYLYGTALQEDAKRTAAGIEMTADLMRHTLNGMQETYVTLASEITFIRQYLELQMVRLALNDQASITVNIKDTDEPLQIAPMLLIPFIENAFKYMYAESRIPFISIQLVVQDGKLQLHVKNSTPQNKEGIAGTKNGLSLTKKRLELLYPAKHKLRLSAMQDYFEVNLDLTLR